jgi:VanZ family protein
MLQHRWVSYGAVAAVVAVGTLAHLGWLPTHWLTWPYADKMMHLLLVGSLAFWFVMLWGDRRVALGGLSVPLAVAAPFALAAIEEGLQSYSPRRSAELADLLCDLLGLIIFWWLACRHRRLGAKGTI